MKNHFALSARKGLPVYLALLALSVSTILGAGCGAGWGEGGDPLGLVAEDAYEVEMYRPATYLAQELPDSLSDGFDDMQQDFERFGIDLGEMNQFVKVVVECCDYRKTGLAGGTKIYIIDGAVNAGAVKGKLADEGFTSRMSGEYEMWEKRGLIEEFRNLDRVAVVFLPEEGYLLVGSSDGIYETLYEIDRDAESGQDPVAQALDRDARPLVQVIDRLGDGWQESGRLDAQTAYTSNTHCAHDVRNDGNCEATAYYTAYGERPLRTSMVTLYETPEDADTEADKIEGNMEESGVYLDVEVEIEGETTDGPFVEMAVRHDKPLERVWTLLY